MQDVIWPIEPHTKAKHGILRRYLQAWFPIIAFSGSPRLVYVDGFAGPGEYDGGEEGSPAIAMRTLIEHKSRQKFSDNSSQMNLLGPLLCAQLVQGLSNTITGFCRFCDDSLNNSAELKRFRMSGLNFFMYQKRCGHISEHCPSVARISP